MSSMIGLYNYHQKFFTGTDIQPDTISLFFKKEKHKDLVYVCHAEPSVTVIGKAIPVIGSLTGIARIVNSVAEIFDNFSKPVGTTDYWNAFKNLMRGIAEAIPFSGLFLIIYDAVRNTVSVHAKIAESVKHDENIFGIAVDGKIVFTIDVADYNKFLEKRINKKTTSDLESFLIFKEASITTLENNKKVILAVSAVFQNMKDKINKIIV